ncbi:hypothetical protein [Streptomyces sp. NRRL S-87]|nr:hypothetical protein [Streptomyces sp. NRRL S-87]
MTDVDAAKMPVADFEELAHAAPEAVRIGFINGKLEELRGGGQDYSR